MLTESTARDVEWVGYALIVVSAFLAVFRWERTEKVAHKLHVAAGFVSLAIVSFAVAQENAQHLVTFPCFALAQQEHLCTSRPLYVPKAQPSCSDTQFHTVPKEFAVLLVATLVALGVRRLIRGQAVD